MDTKLNDKLVALMKQVGVVDEKVLQEKLKHAYYTGTPVISDEQYDELFGDKDYVGYTPDQNGPWQVLKHKIAMGSLNKIKTWKDAEDFVKKHQNQVVWEPKLDGLSMELVYEQGYLTHAILRGGGDEGEDVLKNARHFNFVPATLDPKLWHERKADYISVRGEVVISQSNFKQLLEETKESYSNRRNCVPGICRRYDGAYSDYLSFWSYDIIEQNDQQETLQYSNELDKLVALYSYGFKLPFAFNIMSETGYNEYGDIRDTAEDFQMDGLVIKALDMSEQIALKFEPKGEQTTVTDYTWEVGSTGKLVPIIWFEPVTVGGTKLQKASGASLRNIRNLNAPIGSIVEVRKMNDVIPKVTRRITSSEQELSVPTHCPICGSILEEQGADLYCINPDCKVKLENKCTAVYWAVAIKGITDGWIKKLIDMEVIKEPADVLKVTAEQMVSAGNFSMQRAEKVLAELKQKWKAIVEQDDFKTFLYMLPIPTISGKSFDKLCSIFSFVNQLDAFERFLIQPADGQRQELIDELGNAKGTKAYEYLRENSLQILRLLLSLKELV